MIEPPCFCRFPRDWTRSSTAPDASVLNACANSVPVSSLSTSSLSLPLDTSRSRRVNTRDIAVPPASTFMPVEAIADDQPSTCSSFSPIALDAPAMRCDSCTI